MLTGWTTMTIHGKNAEVYTPPAKPRFGLIFLHDENLSTLTDQATFTRLFESLALAVVCPHGGQCWWTARLCTEFDATLPPAKHVVEQVIPFFDERWNLRPRALGVFGIGMGGQGALRLAFQHPDLFPAAAGIASALDCHERYGQGTPLDEMYASKEQCRQDTTLMHVQPFHYPPHIFFCVDPDDPWHRGNDRLHEKLAALGIEHTCDLTTEAGGHAWTYFERMAEPVLRFLTQGLDKESRRLM